jgi:hypothetical protein
MIGVPTPQEIREYRQWRGRFISALWDAQAASYDPAFRVPDLLREIGADVLPEHGQARLVNELAGDGLIEAFAPTLGFAFPQDVRLTSYGRLEVERWISDDEPTEHLALPPSQVFNTYVHGDVTGSAIVVGSTGTTVNLQVAVRDQLSDIIAKTRHLLTQWDQVGDARESVEADVEILEEERRATQPKAGRLKAALRRLMQWSAGVAAAGLRPELAGEVQHLAHDVMQQL